LGTETLSFVMAGLDPAIHDCPSTRIKDVDARDKPGHDEEKAGSGYCFSIPASVISFSHSTS
jgi:hypothetical protein